MTLVQVFRSRQMVAVFGATCFFCCAASVVRAQNTYTWASPGANSLYGNGANWVGGVGPTLPGAPGAADSAFFSASTNTTVKLPDDENGAGLVNMTFDASAPAYSFTNFPDKPGNDFEFFNGTVLNQSAHTQDFTGIPDIYLDANTPGPSAIIDASGGDASTHLGFKFNTIYYSTSGPTPGFPIIQGSFDTSIVSYIGLSANHFLYKEGSGTLFITGNDGTTPGRLGIGDSTGLVPGPMGAVRIATNNALGLGGSTASGGSYTQIFGGTNSDGRLELTNNITTNEGIVLNGREADIVTFSYNNSLNPAIVNVSGNNTMTGPIKIGGTGGAYNFASTSGTLTVTPDINWNIIGDRYLTAQGAGNITFNGSLSNSHTTSGVPDGDVSVLQMGAGTLTLAGATNANMGNIVVSAGTLAVGATSTFAFRPLTDNGLVPQVFIQNNSTLDVSAVSGGFTLSQPLQGTGNVLGSLIMASGTQVIPGGGPVFDSVQTWNLTGISYGVGQLHFHNGLDLSAGSTMVWHLGALSTANPGTDFDQMTVNGSLALGGTSALSVDLSLLSGAQAPGGGDPFWNTSHTWTIINSPINPGSTNFASLVGASVATGTFSTSYVPPVPGDVDHNGVVNGLDIALIAANWLHTGAPGIPGDADLNGVVNGLDISLIAGNWLQSGPLGGIVLTYTPSGPGAAVPEPSTFLLAGLGLVGLVAIRRQRR